MRIYSKTVKVLGVTRQELKELKEMVLDASTAKNLPAGHSVERNLGHNQFLMLDVNDSYEHYEPLRHMPLGPKEQPKERKAY